MRTAWKITEAIGNAGAGLFLGALGYRFLVGPDWIAVAWAGGIGFVLALGPALYWEFRHDEKASAPQGNPEA